MALTLEQLFSATGLQEQDVPIPGLGTVRIREMTKAQQQALRKEATNKYNSKDGKIGEINNEQLEGLMVVHSVIDPQMTPADILRLRQLPSRIFDRILKAILKINGLTEEAVPEAEATFPAEGRQTDGGAV